MREEGWKNENLKKEEAGRRGGGKQALGAPWAVWPSPQDLISSVSTEAAHRLQALRLRTPLF